MTRKPLDDMPDFPPDKLAGRGPKLYVAHLGEDIFGVFSSRERAINALETSASWQALKRATEKVHLEAYGPTVPIPPLEPDLEEVRIDEPCMP